MKNDQLKVFSVPHLLHIETTYACNSNCIFCYNPRREEAIDYRKIDKLVESVYQSQIPHVYLIGGEPSLLKEEKLNEYIDKLSEVSSVTIVTNALRYKKLSRKLACVGVPIHGDRSTHEGLNTIDGSYKKIIKNIKKYVADGHDVRCIPVLMSVNYNQMYEIIKLAKQLSMESVFVDRFESGGIGSKMTKKLMPTTEQFKIALGQMIKARDKFDMLVGFGTAIPYCLDERLLTEDVKANCGAGTTFCAVDPSGELRICNQSDISYGNILEQSVEKIWNKKKVNEFRDLKWTIEPCGSCVCLTDCVGGCKVDLNYCSKFCVDYSVRNEKDTLVGQKTMTKLWQKYQQKKRKEIKHPKNYRKFELNRYTKINEKHKENYLVTRYQTVVLNNYALDMLKDIKKGISKEKDLIKKYKDRLGGKEVRKFVSKLEMANAINIK